MKWITLILGLIFSTNAIAQERNLVHLIQASEKSFITKKAPVDAYKNSLINKDEMWIYWMDSAKLIERYYKELVSKEYQPCDYKLGQIKKYDNGHYSKSDTFYFVNKKKGIIIQVRNNQSNEIDGDDLGISSNWYSPTVRLSRKSEPEYEFENYFTAKAFKKFDFSLIESSKLKIQKTKEKKENLANTKMSSVNGTVIVEAENKTLPNLEKIILSGKKPIGEGIQTKYDDEQWRLITWRAGSSNKIYNYSIEKMDMLGYEFVKVSISDRRHKVYVYRNCNKNLVLEVNEWFDEKMLVLDLKWYDKSIKNRIGYLMFCDLK